MKNSIKITSLLIALFGMSLKAQSQQNRLIVPDIDVQYGEAQLPITVENTDEIVGVQFDLALPDGITAKSTGTLSNRGDDHAVNVKHMGGQVYRIMVYSPTNSPLRGQSGTAFYLPVVIPENLPDGSEHQPSLSNGVLSIISGENVLTDVSVGKIRISRLPDLLPSNLTCDETTIEPGQTISMSWQVANVGDLSTTGGWSEQVSLVSDDGEVSKLISTTHYNELLAAGGTVSRQVSVALPTLLGIDGDATLQIRIIPDTDCGEKPSAQGNNTLEGNQQLSIQKLLTFELSPTRVDENRNTRVSLKVTRSGRWTESMTFPITATSDGRAPVPSEITIPANQASAIVYFNIVNNDVLDNDSVVNISVGGNGYTAVKQTLMVIDDEFPDLRVTSSKTDIMEGESFQLTISTMRVSSYPIVVTLTSENTRRFSFPATATIPAGQESVTVTVETIDDEVPSLNLSNNFTVSAPMHNKAETIVLLTDNDLPALELTLTPTTVSEGVGVVAVAGTLRRTTNINNKITVKLTDDANGGLYFGNRTFELAKGVEEVHFNFGPIDNATVDGDRTYNITAAVWISSCNCGVSGESAGYSTAQLQVLDDDGAALGLAASVTTVKEGSATTLTISRNTDTSSPLNVTLSSDYAEGLTYPSSVTIPAGQLSTTVEVTSAGNDVQGDSHNVIFTVQANGFATGTCFITVTDQTKPDAVISDISADSYEVEVGQTIALSITIVNNGIAVLPAQTEVRINCSGSSERQTLYTPDNLAAGESVVLTSDYKLPVTNTGTYTLTATVNPDQSVSELNFNNNSLSTAAITLNPNFSAIVSVDKQVYRQGETVVISGQTSAGGRNADVEIYLVNNGARQSLIVKADENGRFQTTYQPYDRQAGHFVVGACYPKTGETSGSAEFDVYGLILSGVYATHDISLDDEVTGSFVIKNPGMLPQTGLQIERQTEANGCELNIGDISTIDADGQVQVSYSLKANAVSPGNDWLQVPLRITSNEGCSSTFTVYYYVRPLKGQLKASQTRIETTMTKGVPRDYHLQVTNVGRGETGRISLSLPSWIELATVSTIPSLHQGDTVTIALRMMPNDDMQLNVPITGQIGINCEKGDGVAVALNVTPVSDVTGSLVIDVVDEYFYYAEGNPHVEGARVLVKHPTTGEVIAQGLTASDGHYSVELPEGWYTVSINADKHQGYQTTLEVAPGRDTGKQIFLTYEAVSYSWEVVETEVEDEYQIETVVKFETNVPKPVVLITLPDEKPEIGGVVPVVVTNKGLIAANRVDLTLSVSGGLTLEWLTDPSMSVLAPQQSAVFYAVLKGNDVHSARRQAPSENAGTCISLNSKVRSYYMCGDCIEEIITENSRAWGNCLSGSGNSSSWSGGGGGGGSSWGGSSTGSYPSFLPGSSGSLVYAGSSIGANLSPVAKMCHEIDLDELLTLPEIGKIVEPISGGCGKIQIAGFQLYPYEDEAYKVHGVAADGESKVRIELAEGDNILPIDEDCGNPRWHIEEGIGELENENSWYGVVYKAPADFPGGPDESSVTVHAVLEYDVNGELRADSVEIVVTRAPLVLLHGYIGDHKAWDDFYDRVTANGEYKDYPKMYSNYQVLNYDYKERNMDHFMENVSVAGERINKIIYKYLCHGIVAKKADLVGHSMGGIIARLHVQYGDDGNGDKNVHKVITVNTPHSGSRLGVVADKLTNLQEIVNSEFIDYFFDTDYELDFTILHAGRDLWNNSSATYDYLNDVEALKKMENIPVHAIVTYGMKYMPDDNSEVFNEIISDGLILFLLKTGFLKIVDEAVDERNDLIVSVESQKGGLEEPFIHEVPNQWHMGSPRNPKVQEYLIDLLNASVKSGCFCKTGFKPKRIYKSRKKTLMYSPTNLAARRNSAITKLVVTANVSDNILNATMTGSEGYDYKMMLVKFGNHSYCMSDNTQVECEVPASFIGEAKVYGIVRMEDEDVVWDVATVNIDELRTTMESIYISDISVEIGEPSLVSLTCIWADGSKTHVKPDEVAFTNNLASYENGIITGLHGGSGTATFTYQGLTCEAPITVYNFGKGDGGENSKSVCSTISLKLSQTMTMTRQAFRGTLTVFNGNESAAMRDVKLTLQVTNKETGEVATSHEFQINAESIEGFTGEVDLTSGWTLAGNNTGTATVLFIPTKYAAPTEPVEWAFGGTLSYLDPFTGLIVTRDLYPVTLTVKPSPELDLTYFMQRDVYGDDPLTLDVVEPMKPAEFALLINNKGYGDATNVKMVTQQPEIIENEKGLAIDFELISSQVNGADATLSFGQTIANNFGTIPAHSQMYAQWWLTSTLLGHFTDYDVHATHITSYGNEDLSLLDEVTIHELIHGFDLSTDEHPLRAFLVNDLPDSEDLPDMLYLSNGEIENVLTATSSVVDRTSNTTCKLTIVPSAAGWNYGNLLDPTHGMATVKSIVRQSDGKEMAADNFWQTDRTLRDGKDWLYENRLHFIDELTGTGAETYVITFNPIPDVVLEVESIEVVPEEGTVAVEPVETLAVTFSKPIEPETFTADDLTFSVQGAKQDASLIGISTADNKSFTLDLKTVTEQCPNGYYTLTVQTADITDNEGYQGKTGKQVGWIMYRGGLVQLLTSAWPENSGKVTRLNDEAGARSLAPEGEEDVNTAKYGSNVTLMAEPETGYEFTNWTLNGEVVSTNAEFTTTALGDMNVVANFTKKKYMVNVNVEGTGGTVDGTATGIYDFGTEVNVTAVPDDDYVLKEWTVNGKAVEDTDTKLTMIVDKALDIDAMFMQEYYRQSITLAKGWNWISAYLREPLSITDLSQYANRIMSQTDELINDPEFGLVGSMSELMAGQAYKIEANSRFTNIFRGHLYNISENPINLHKGWNWVAFPFMDIAPISAMTTAEEGDFITSQKGFAEYADGFWAGTLDTFTPGEGYLYKSASDKYLGFDAAISVNGSRTWAPEMTTKTEHEIDIYRYPNTMNVTARIYRDGTELVSDDYVIYAMVGDEVRGISQYVSGNHYITVYGDEPVDVTFLVEYTETGETYATNEVLEFCSDVVGSRKSPYAINISGATGIESFDSTRTMTIYTIEGLLVSRDATLKTLRRLPKGVYIVNGQKYLVK